MQTSAQTQTLALWTIILAYAASPSWQLATKSSRDALVPLAQTDQWKKTTKVATEDDNGELDGYKFRDLIVAKW
jgi:hypothetical protein